MLPSIPHCSFAPSICRRLLMQMLRGVWTRGLGLKCSCAHGPITNTTNSTTVRTCSVVICRRMRRQIAFTPGVRASQRMPRHGTLRVRSERADKVDATRRARRSLLDIRTGTVKIIRGGRIRGAFLCFEHPLFFGAFDLAQIVDTRTPLRVGSGFHMMWHDNRQSENGCDRTNYNQHIQLSETVCAGAMDIFHAITSHRRFHEDKPRTVKRVSMNMLPIIVLMCVYGFTSCSVMLRCQPCKLR